MKNKTIIIILSILVVIFGSIGIYSMVRNKNCAKEVQNKYLFVSSSDELLNALSSDKTISLNNDIEIVLNEYELSKDSRIYLNGHNLTISGVLKPTDKTLYVIDESDNSKFNINNLIINYNTSSEDNMEFKLFNVKLPIENIMYNDIAESNKISIINNDDKTYTIVYNYVNFVNKVVGELNGLMKYIDSEDDSSEYKVSTEITVFLTKSIIKTSKNIVLEDGAHLTLVGDLTFENGELVINLKDSSLLNLNELTIKKSEAYNGNGIKIVGKSISEIEMPKGNVEVAGNYFKIK